MATTPRTRTRPDRCPGVTRPWPAEDGALVRVRLVGGAVSSASLRALLDVARRYGDGAVHLTGRANLQLRGLPVDGPDGRLPEEVVAAVEATGLLPSRSHELARNVMVSPATGLAGGRVNLRAVAGELDRLLCAEPALASLPGRFLFVLDDGRGDLAGRATDLGCVALDEDHVQVRVGSHGWGPAVPLDALVATLVGLAGLFVRRRGEAPDAPWHVDELPTPLVGAGTPDARVHVHAPPLPFGPGPAGDHVVAPDGVLDPAVATRADHLVVTPWRGVLVPTEVAA